MANPSDELIARLTEVSRFISFMWHQMPMDFRRRNQADNLSAGSALNDAITALSNTQPQAPASDRAMVLEEAALLLEAAIEEGYAAPANRVDECKHGKFGWEDCIACYDERLLEVAAAIRQLAASPHEGGSNV